MATIKKFEELDAWKKARELASKIYAVSCEGKFSKDFKFRDQINDAAGSIMDNIAEGFERSGRNEFINFLAISKGSCGEVKSQLYRALDRGYITEEKFKELYELANEIGKLEGGLIEYLNKSNYKGSKYKERVKPETQN
jgi:four helix bundle protein